MESAPVAGEAPNRFIAVGEIVKAIGLKGEVKLFPLLDYHAGLLRSGYLVWSDGKPAAVIRHRQAGSCEALTMRDVNDRNAAEGLVGRELGFMSHSYLAPDFPQPPGGLPFRWLGRPVRTVSGEMLGEVDEVRVAGAGYMLVLDDPQAPGRELLVPAVPPILQPENELGGVLVVDPPEGLFDVQRG